MKLQIVCIHSGAFAVTSIVIVNGAVAGEAGTWLIIRKQTSKKTIMLRVMAGLLGFCSELSDHRAGDNLGV